jgi:aryl-alcohol dehydrogenase-like predicted oxidoreductase
MKFVEVGGARMSAIGLGTWQFGSREWGYGNEYAERDAIEIVHRALEMGITTFDTAEIYAFGRSERILGRALEGRRDEAFLATKIFPAFPIGAVVLQRARGSIRRLGVSNVDLYQIHQPNPVVPLSSTMAGFGQLLDEGVIKHAGVSNYALARWQAADAALGRAVLSNQVRFNLVDRRAEKELLPWAQAHERVIIAYSPLAQGLLSGRYDAGHRPSGMVRTNSPAFLPENLALAEPLIEAVRKVAAGHGATPSQVALAWLIRRPHVVVIPGASSVAQVEANAAAADLELSDEEDAALCRASDDFHPRGVREVWPQLARERFEGVAERLRGWGSRGRPAGPQSAAS